MKVEGMSLNSEKDEDNWDYYIKAAMYVCVHIYVSLCTYLTSLPSVRSSSAAIIYS